MDDIVWTRRALRNLDDIGEYIVHSNPTAAQYVVRRIIEKVSGLAFYPLIGRKGSVDGTREPVISDTPYIAVYRVKERVEILRIRHGAQKWPE